LWFFFCDEAAMEAHSFLAPWSVEEQPAWFVVRDNAGQKLAYVYFEEGPGRRSAGQAARDIAQDLIRRTSYNGS